MRERVEGVVRGWGRRGVKGCVWSCGMGDTAGGDGEYEGVGDRVGKMGVVG
jgi:hypothetical protein